MLSRALSLATVTLLIGCLAQAPAQAQAQNLEAGKSPSQIFAGTCNACHKSPRGLLKTVPAGSLPGFLRQHYTTSGEMASLLSAFLVSNGAADTRYVGAPPKPGRDAKSDAKPAGGPPDQLDRFGHRLRPVSPAQEAVRRDAEPREAAKPDADGLSQGEPGRPGRNAKRLARPGEAPDAAKPAADGQAPAQAGLERGPDGRKSGAKERLSKRGRPGEELPKTDAAKDTAKEESAKSEAVKDDKPPANEAAKDEASKADGAKPPSEGKGDGKSESAKIEAPKEAGGGSSPVLRADPVPPVTPAPSASPAVSAAVSSAAPEPVRGPSAAPAFAPPTAVTASAPPLVAPAGPPTPPISQ
jgi:hypothetical protein